MESILNKMKLFLLSSSPLPSHPPLSVLLGGAGFPHGSWVLCVLHAYQWVMRLNHGWHM